MRRPRLSEQHVRIYFESGFEAGYRGQELYDAVIKCLKDMGEYDTEHIMQANKQYELWK
jgi:hypothetical protein